MKYNGKINLDFCFHMLPLYSYDILQVITGYWETDNPQEKPIWCIPFINALSGNIVLPLSIWYGSGGSFGMCELN